MAIDDLQYQQGLLFDDRVFCDAYGYSLARRTNGNFLRNQYAGVGRFELPLVRKQVIDLSCIQLIACTNTRANEREFASYGVHFFVDDYKFNKLYEAPEKSYPIYSQYRFCLTPDYSVYGEMPIWRQIQSVAHGRWCGAWWQGKGMTVIPTISWAQYSSYDFCFDGVEQGSIVAISTYACRRERLAFLRGCDAMLEHINPEAIICYGEPFPYMRGNLLPVKVCHPRQFHRVHS